MTRTPLSWKLPFEGEVFDAGGRPAFLILPGGKPAAGMPWVLYAPAFAATPLPGPEETWMFRHFQDAGIAIAGADIGESYGNPAGRAVLSALHGNLAGGRGLARRACLLARSRGGLMLYNWAAEHPDLVACVAGIYPVCDIRSYPGLAGACAAYCMTEEQLGATVAAHNPVDRLEPLARAGVPIFHIHGDNDAVVPLDANSGELAKRYRALGGSISLKIVEGGGHDMWDGWFQCRELVDFVIARAALRNI